MIDNNSDADMDPRTQMFLEQIMAGPDFSQIWHSMIPHVLVVNGDDPESLVKDIDQIATKLTDRYFEMVAKERAMAEQRATEAAPSPIKFTGVDD